MGLFEFRKPKWRHKDPAMRLESIASIDPQETEIFTTLSRDQDQEVRRAAINRLADLTVLSQLAKDADPEDLPLIVARKDSLLYKQLVECRDTEEWRDNLDQITSPDLLAKLAVDGRQPAVRLAAVNRIEDQQLLAGIVKQNCGKQPALAAMAKITDEALLADLSESAASKTARRLAAATIAEMEQQRNQPSDKELVAQRLNALAAEAAQLQAGPDMDAAARRLAAIQEEWQHLDNEYNHPAYRAFCRIRDDVEERRYKEILDRRKIGQEKAARHEQFHARLDELCGIIERVTCSTANDSEAVKEQAAAAWATLVHDPNEEMVPSATIAKRFTDACRAFDANREKIHHEKGRVEIIATQCANISELIAGHDLKKAAARLVETKKILAPMKFNYFNKTQRS